MDVLTAIAEGNVAALAAALAAGSDPRVVDTEGVPAILHAADTGRVDLLEPLLVAGASIEATDNIGWTALMAAIASGSDALAAHLLKRGANANHVAREDTPLTIAVADAPQSLVTMLLNHGADPNLRRPDGWTPLMLAAFGGEVPRIRLLLEQGADPTVTMGARLVDAATVAAVHRHFRARDVLLDAARSSQPALGEIWGGIQKWCESKAPELADRFEATVGAAEIPDAWQGLPADVELQLTRWASGLPFYDYQSVGIDQAVALWQDLCARHAAGEFADRSPTSLGPDEPVERTYWSDAWVPVAKDPEGNLLLVDLGPEETGISGQLLSWSVEQGPIAVLASGLTPYLRLLSARLRAGRIRVDKRTQALLPT